MGPIFLGGHFVWLAIKNKDIVGYIVTQPYTEYNKPAIYIRQGYIAKEHRGNGIYECAMEVLEQNSIKLGVRYLTCKTYLDPRMYARFIGKRGFRYKATEFIKEI